MQRIIFSILVLLSLCTLTAGAQKRRVQNKPFIDERRFHYGFTFGLHDQSIRLSNNGYTDPETGRQWLAQNDNHNLGFSVGVLAGFSPMYDLTAGKHTLLRTRELSTMLELGMGCDLYLPFFKLIPELKFCIGLGNVLKKDRSDLLDSTQMIFTQSVDRATTHMVVLSFYFE